MRWVVIGVVAGLCWWWSAGVAGATHEGTCTNAVGGDVTSIYPTKAECESVVGNSWTPGGRDEDCRWEQGGVQEATPYPCYQQTVRVSNEGVGDDNAYHWLGMTVSFAAGVLAFDRLLAPIGE